MLMRRYASTIATDANNGDDCEPVEATTSASSASAGATNNNAASSSSLGDNGYLGKILNAKVYDVAVETELQHAENLSQVSSSVEMKASPRERMSKWKDDECCIDLYHELV